MIGLLRILTQPFRIVLQEGRSLLALLRDGDWPEFGEDDQ